MRAIVVLGVDFMSENVRAMLDASGFADVVVYRAVEAAIGCSLAQSAEALEYGAYLAQARKTPHSLHVIYINTSLVVKAQSHAVVPTITCTSSNVVATILQAAAQIPDVSIWFGPDTYMGENLASLLDGLGAMSDEAVARVHSDHTAESVRALASRFHYFRQGTCIVHHMFGSEVAERVRNEYSQSFVTAHLEVPGEMFALGLERQQRGDGVVGSTSNILGFIHDKVDAAASAAEDGSADLRLSFVLGTEAGMVTPIVHSVQEILRAHDAKGHCGVEAEIVFPVAGEAVAATGDEALPLVPGVSGGEGCSTAGGCATCPFMKMNSADALFDLLDLMKVASAGEMKGFEPKHYAGKIQGRTIASMGSESILHMRAYQRDGVFSDELVRDVLTRTGVAA